MKNLKNALLGNAIFSIVCGILLISFPAFWADQFELSVSTPFLIIGLGLVVFSATVFYEAFKQRCWAVIWIIVQDMIWVLGSIILLLTQPFGIGFIGNLIIFLIATIVLLFGLWQVYALPDSYVRAISTNNNVEKP